MALSQRCLHGFCRTVRRQLCHTRRMSAAIGAGTQRADVFDRRVKQLQRDRASAAADAHVYDYLKDEVGWRVADRLADVRRQFDTVLDLGCGRGHVIKHLDSELVGAVTACDLSQAHVRAALGHRPVDVQLSAVQHDEQLVEQLQLPADSLALAVSCLSLHWLNAPAVALQHVWRALRPDAPLVGACFGGHTLHQLRTSLQLACLERRGGVRDHMSPLLEPVDVTSLLSRAGFTLITVDVDSMTVHYPSALHLMWDLQGMAESGAPARPDCVHLGRDVLIAAAAIYREMFGEKQQHSETEAAAGDHSTDATTDDTCVPATFQVIHFIGWKPSPDQPQPVARGSAQVSFKDLAKIVTQAPPNTQSHSPPPPPSATPADHKPT